MEHEAMIRDLQQSVDRLREELERRRDEYEAHLTVLETRLALAVQGIADNAHGSTQIPVSVDEDITPGVHTQTCTDRADRTAGTLPAVAEATFVGPAEEAE